MQHKKFLACAAGAVLAIAIACSKNSPAPVAPTSTEAGGGEAAADGSTLKVTAPTPQSPVNDAQPEALVLVAGAATGRFQQGVSFSYDFEIKNAAGTTVCVVDGAAAVGSTVTAAPSCQIEMDAPHTWRVRATRQGAMGPWSAAASFRSPAGGYIRGNEVFDPLTNGKTVGDVVGAVTFLQGTGVRLEDFGSHIRYRLPQTLQEGEFSMIITNMATNTEGDKTKVMCMSQGLNDIITNDRRMTVEKRGDPPGIVAWRLITHGDQVDTEGAEREFREFNERLPYLFTATWRGNEFRVTIRTGGADGPVLYSKGKHFEGRAYDPDPHYAFAGCPSGRSGPSAATVPGMVVRNLWISSRPRPAGL